MKWKQPAFLITGFITLSIIVGLSISFFVPQDEGETAENEGDFLHELETETTEQREEQESEDSSEVPRQFVVDVKGEVKHPGVYDIKEGKRVIDAIDLAGGLSEDAHPMQVNFAERVYDEMIIYIPEEGEKTELSESNKDKKVRVNYADAAELESLPGIGPAKAEAILTFRDEHGLFQSPEDLQEVSGIGDKSIEQLKEAITTD